MVDKACIKKGCNWKRTHGYFCQKHRVPEPLLDPGPRCAAIGCRSEPKGQTWFCGDHQRAMDRALGYYASDNPIEPFRAPLPDRRPALPKDAAAKLVVKLDRARRHFVAAHPYTGIVGVGQSPGEAIEDFIYWHRLIAGNNP